MSDELVYLKMSIQDLKNEIKASKDATDFASLLKLIEMEIYPKEILLNYPKLMEKFCNRLDLPKIR